MTYAHIPQLSGDEIIELKSNVFGIYRTKTRPKVSEGDPKARQYSFREYPVTKQTGTNIVKLQFL